MFYRNPRFVAHIDEHTRAAVTPLYRGLFPDDGAVLVLMSNWISHLPSRPGHATAGSRGWASTPKNLRGNPGLTEHVVHDLNADPSLPYCDREFDACGLCVSID